MLCYFLPLLIAEHCCRVVLIREPKGFWAHELIRVYSISDNFEFCLSEESVRVSRSPCAASFFLHPFHHTTPLIIAALVWRKSSSLSLVAVKTNSAQPSSLKKRRFLTNIILNFAVHFVLRIELITYFELLISKNGQYLFARIMAPADRRTYFNS